MKKFKIGQILFYIAMGLIFGGGAVAIISGVLFEDAPDWIVIIMAMLIILGICLVFVASALIADKGTVRKSRKKYKALPYTEVEDYKAELEAMRQSFAADPDKTKNHLPSFAKKGLRKYFDFSAITKGKVCYGCLVEANDQLFKRFYSLSTYMLPAVFVYSLDEHFEEHPLDLQPIAEKLFENRHNNFLKNEKEYFYNIKLPTDTTEGREVYATTVFVYRPQLPAGYVAGALLPLVVAPESSTSCFVLEEKYWSQNLACHFVNGGDRNKRIDFEIKKSADLPQEPITDYAAELVTVRENFIKATEAEPEEVVEEEQPFGELGKESANERYTVNYAYVVLADDKSKSPYGKQDVFPVIALCSDDDTFKENPYALKEVAKKFAAMDAEQREYIRSQVINYKTHGLSEVRLPSDMTDGREVYAYGVLVYRYHLPTFAITHNLMPVVRASERLGGLTYSISKEYWSPALISAYVHGDLEALDEIK